MLQLWFVVNTVAWPFSIKLAGLTLNLNVIVLLLAGPVWLWKKRRITSSSAKVLLLLLAYLIFSVLVALNAPCNDEFLKSVITAPILMFLVFIGWEVGRRVGNRDWLKLQKAAIWTLLVAFSAFFMEIAVPSWFPHQAGYRIGGEFSGLFSEPSEVAFSLFPCVVVLLVAESRKIRRSGMLALLGLLLFSRSSTLLALIAAWILYRLLIQRRLGQAGLLALGFTALIALGSAINYGALVAPTMNRIMGVAASSESENLSSLVYVQGWQDAWANIVRTHGLGLGFNMMGCHPLPDVPVRAILALEGMEELNSQNGSFLFGKIVSETGVGGLVFYGAIIWWWVRLEKKISAAEDSAGRLAAATQAALIFCFVASSFMRSAGYFSGGMLLWIVAVSGASKLRKKLPTKPARQPGRFPDIGREPPGAVECA